MFSMSPQSCKGGFELFYVQWDYSNQVTEEEKKRVNISICTSAIRQQSHMFSSKHANLMCDMIF